MTDERILRVFISSPSDVRPERLIAERVVKRLALEFMYYFRVEPVLWEREPLLATHHFQDLIIPPRETDIVVGVLWSRLGVPLPEEKYRGAITKNPVTGTEWEFEDAVAGFEVRGLPDLLFYRKQAKITVELGDRTVLEEQQRQADLVDDFMRRWFRTADGKSFSAASWAFTDVTEFESLLEEHLRALLRKRLTRPQDIETPATITWHQGSPYRGLESFEIEHAPVFFGRTRARNDVRELIARQEERGCSFVLVMGASGSGKSSLVKAGVLPDLLLPGMVGRVALCRYGIARPGAVVEGRPADVLAGIAQALLAPTALPELAVAPFEYSSATLRNLLERAPTEAAQPIRQGLSAAGQKAGLTARGEARLILVVDQLEELFTAAIAQAERERYAAALEALARSGLVWVIATMRSDFFDRLATVPALAALSSGEASYLLAPPDAGEIGQIVRRPAREAGLHFEIDNHTGQSLDETIREAAANNRNALPLLEYLLDQLWQSRSADGVLTFAAYNALHGLEGAIGKRAEDVLSALPPDVQEAFPSVMRTLVTVASQTAVATARLVPLSHYPEGSAARRLVESLIHPQARILVADSDRSDAQVRVAHEALLTHWERARLQITADRRDIRTRARLEEAEARWRESPPADRASLLLARGLPLSEAEDLVARRGAELNPALVSFVTASTQAVRNAERRRTRIRRSAAAVLMLLLLGASGLAALSWYQWGEAGKANNVAHSVQRLARHTSDAGALPQRSLLLAVHAAALNSALKGGNQLDDIDTLRQQLRSIGGHPLPGHAQPTRAATISGDGRLLATASEDGAIRLWNLDNTDPTARSTLLSGHTGLVHELAFSPDGKWLASGGEDGTLRLWHVTPDGATAGPRYAPRGARAIRTLTISPSGEWLVFGTASGQVCIWKLINAGAAEAPCSVGAQRAPVSKVLFSAKGRWLATAAFFSGHDGDPEDKFVRLWDFSTGPGATPPRLLTHKSPLPEDALLAIALSADETRLAAAYGYNAEVWDLTKDEPPDHVILRANHDQWIGALSFSADGRWLATGAGDSYAKLWDLTNPGAPPIPLDGHIARINTVTFSDDGRWLATGGDDAMALLWDFHDPRALSSKVLRGQEASITRVMFSPGPEPRHLVAVGGDRSARLWTIPGSAADPIALRGHKGAVRAAAVSHDGNWIASASAAETELVLWSVKDPREPARRLSVNSPVSAIAFSADGRWLAASFDNESVVRLWRVGDLSRPALELPNGGEAGLSSLGFSPDNRWLLSGAWNNQGELTMWDVSAASPSPTPRYSCREGAPVRALAFSADGRFAITGEHGPRAHIWDLQAADPCRSERRLGPHLDAVVDVAVSSDSRWAATASFDGKGRLWNVSAGREPKLVAEAPFGGRAFGAAFSPDAHWVAFVSWDFTAKLFDLTKMDLANDAAANLPIVFAGHVGRVLSVAFSPDSRWLLTSGEDRTVRIWDPSDPRIAPVALHAHEGSVSIVGFLPDERLVTRSVDRTIMLWHLRYADLVEIACRTAGRQLTADEVRDFIGEASPRRPCAN